MKSHVKWNAAINSLLLLLLLLLLLKYMYNFEWQKQFTPFFNKNKVETIALSGKYCIDRYEILPFNVENIFLKGIFELK